MSVLGALKEACQQVHAQVQGVAGTAKGNRQAGIGAGGDISRQIDILAEKTAIKVLRRRGISSTMIGEECGVIEGEEKKNQSAKKKGDGFVMMDALDGTTNASRRLPFYCCSLAYSDDFRLSAVRDAAIINLANGDLYYASRGKGAFCNGKKIRVRRDDDDDVIIGMTLSGVQDDTIRKLAPVISKANHVRQLGSLAMELCYLAKGSLDASIDLRGKVRIVDIAAACLIVREAGGQIYSDKGIELDSDLDIKTRLSYVAVANEKIFEDLSTDGIFDPGRRC
jgi:myo-inositol-1(or 4)-monophosphatase